MALAAAGLWWRLAEQRSSRGPMPDGSPERWWSYGLPEIVLVAGLLTAIVFGAVVAFLLRERRVRSRLLAAQRARTRAERERETFGGTIRVASSPGEGATFSFTLPLPEAP